MADEATRTVPPILAVRMVERAVDALGRLQAGLLPPEVQMLNLSLGAFINVRCISLAAELGLADRLHERSLTAEELAAETGVDAPALYRLMKLLESSGLLVDRGGGGRFATTRLGDCLRSDAPNSVRDFVRLGGNPSYWRIWADLDDSIRTGRSLPEGLHGVRFFDWLALDPALERLFDDSMSAVTAISSPAIVAAYPFGKLRSLVDIAGGHGVLLNHILRAHPHLRGTLFDRPAVLERARTAGHLDLTALDGRLTLLAGDLFDTLPAGHDAYLLKWILHDWTDQEVLAILANCRRAMASEARLLVVEMLLEPTASSPVARWMDIVMLAQTGGRERSSDEFRELFRKSDFHLERVFPSASPFSILEASAV